MASFTPTEFVKLPKEEQERLWDGLPLAERSAVWEMRIAQRSRAKAVEAITDPAAYRKPVLCVILYLVSAVSVGFAIILLAMREWVSAGAGVGVALSLLAWAQMLDHIAQAAFYTRRTAEAMALSLKQASEHTVR